MCAITISGNSGVFLFCLGYNVCHVTCLTTTIKFVTTRVDGDLTSFCRVCMWCGIDFNICNVFLWDAIWCNILCGLRVVVRHDDWSHMIVIKYGMRARTVRLGASGIAIDAPRWQSKMQRWTPMHMPEAGGVPGAKDKRWWMETSTTETWRQR